MNGIGLELTNGFNGVVCKEQQFMNSGIKEEDDLKKLIENLLKLSAHEALVNSKDRSSVVVQFETPENLLKILDLDLQYNGSSHETLMKCCKDVFKYSVKTGHPRFFNQLYAGIDPYGFAGEVMTNALNTSMYTYEVAPVFTLMENVVLTRMREIVGYTEGDGTFCPGGSYSNMMALNLSRFQKFPNYREEGMRKLPRMLIFTSDEAHYSVKKNAALLGFATSDVVSVSCDNRGKMDVEELKRLIKDAVNQGDVPLMVNATAGTTVLGAYDSFNEIADCCEKYQVWLHVDASWGGGAMMSPKYAHLCDGIQRSDSVSWNAHKMMMAPLQCCAFLTKHKGLLKRCNNVPVPYLFQPDRKAYDPAYDSGSQLLQCGRKVDCLKLWLMWKAKGDQGFQKQVEKAFDNARYLTEKIKKTQGFKLVIEQPECTNVCFWYVPPSLRLSLNKSEDEKKFKEQLHEVAPNIKQRMAQKGSMLVGYQPLGNNPNFFRMILINEDVNYEDMDFVVNEIRLLGEDL